MLRNVYMYIWICNNEFLCYYCIRGEYEMKKKIFITLGILVVCLMTAVVSLAVTNNIQTSQKKIPSDYHVGITYDEAINDDKPILGLFYVDWCGYCLRFMPKYATLNRLYKDKYNFVMLNAEDPANQKLVEDVALSGFPTMYVIDPKYDNRFLLNNSIYLDLKKLRTELDRYLSIRKRLDDCQKCSDK